LKGPPKATLARRAKSYSDFYDAAVTFLSKETVAEKSRDVLAASEFSPGDKILETGFEDLEEELLDESQEQYRLVLSHYSSVSLTSKQDFTETSLSCPKGILTHCSMIQQRL
jgi:hypothetical protein